MAERDLRWRDDLRTAAASERPLREGLELSPRGPTLLTAAVTSGPSLRAAREEDVPPYREPIVWLRDLAESERGWSSIKVQLVSKLVGGINCYAQTWLARINNASSAEVQIVVKLLVEELFPRAPLEFWMRNADRSAAQSAQAELSAYARLQAMQGRQVPHCYGAFLFEMPWGTMAMGFLLEDLRPITQSLRQLSIKERKAYEDDMAKFEPLATALLSLVHQIHAAGIAHLTWSVDDIFVLKTDRADGRPLVVVCDFGDSFLMEHYVHEVGIHDFPTGPLPPGARDEYAAHDSLTQAFGEIADTWKFDLFDEDPYALLMFIIERRVEAEFRKELEEHGAV